MTAVLTGSQKAAVVLAQLDTERAAKILKAMSEHEVVDLMSTMATLPTLGPDDVRRVLSEFSLRATAAVACVLNSDRTRRTSSGPRVGRVAIVDRRSTTSCSLIERRRWSMMPLTKNSDDLMKACATR